MNDPVPAELDTARLHLRPIVRDDIDLLVDLDIDPEVMRFVGGAPNPRRVYETELIERMTAYVGQPVGYFAAISRLEPDSAPTAQNFVGWFHLRPSVADPSILELGYRLRRDVWGKGLATEGSLALLRRAFYRLGQPAVDACAVPQNGASIAVMKKCGMTRVGVFDHPRGGLHVVRYLVTRAAFDRLHGPAG